MPLPMTFNQSEWSLFGFHIAFVETVSAHLSIVFPFSITFPPEIARQRFLYLRSAAVD
jgi:hypothetical protein